jgi:hypothetical protein
MIMSWAVLAGVGIAAVGRLPGPPAPHWPMAPMRGDTRQLSRLIDRLAAPKEPLVFYEPTALTHLNYLSFAHDCPRSERPVMILDRPADAAALEQLAQFPQVLIIYGQEAMQNPPQILAGWRMEQLWAISQTGCAVRMVRSASR